MTIYAKTRAEGLIKLIDSNLCIGDYVTIKSSGYQYCSYTTAFKYFWGTAISEPNLSAIDKDIVWKIINIVLHGSDLRILCHIRNRKGENAVINMEGLQLSKFHRRNREPIKPIVIHQLPFYMDAETIIPHDWHEKLWDFYENGKILKREKH